LSGGKDVDLFVPFLNGISKATEFMGQIEVKLRVLQFIVFESLIFQLIVIVQGLYLVSSRCNNFLVNLPGVLVKAYIGVNFSLKLTVVKVIA
jgi:hypothetical protein